MHVRMVAEVLTRPDGKALLERTYARVPVAGSFSQLIGWQRGFKELAVAHEFPRELTDAIAIVGGDPSGSGVVLHANTPSQTRMSVRDRAIWVRVAAHLAAGYRLVREPRAEVDAVIAPNGRVVHAEERAATAAQRASLGEQTRAIDRARGRMRRADPDEALAIWRGLVDGEWSLVDHIDSDGKRYVHAKRNAPEVRPWSDLTPGERQVLAYAAEGQPHKVIAYELGIGVSAVSTRMRRAARKVGAASRIELVTAYRRAGSQKP
jgi:DNA-binding CsgD family transcriptional regulator